MTAYKEGPESVRRYLENKLNEIVRELRLRGESSQEIKAQLQDALARVLADLFAPDSRAEMGGFPFGQLAR